MITTEQRLERKKHLGSSDVSALFGLNPFATSYDVFATKVFELKPEEEGYDSEAMEIGNEFETPLVKWCGEQLGSGIETNPDKLYKVCEKHPILASNIDGLLIKFPTQGVEAKTTSQSSEWGENGSDQVPNRVIIQSQMHMLCHNLDLIHIPVLIGRFGLKREMFHVPRNEKIISAIIETGERFWNEHVIPCIAPAITDVPNIEILKRIERVPNSWADISEETQTIIEQWKEKNEERIAVEKLEKDLKAKVIAALGDKEGAKLSMDAYDTLTFFSQRGAPSFDMDKFKTEHSDLYSMYVKENYHRTLRLKKRK